MTGGMKLILSVVVALFSLGASVEAKTVKVFILSGQSNMVGWAHVRTLEGEKVLLERLRDRRGRWIERDDVFIHAQVGDDVRKGKLSVGYGGNGPEWIGPELTFGIEMGDRFEEPVLLIKAAWGGKDLYCDFRPPSAGQPTYTVPPHDGEPREFGANYRQLVAHVRLALDGIATDFPALKRHEVELAGFVWFQGWNEMFCADEIREDVYAEYPSNFAALVDDLRREFDAPQLPAVVGEMGVNGDGANERIRGLREAQALIPYERSLRGTVTFVRTAPLWDEAVDGAFRDLEKIRDEQRRKLEPKIEKKLARKLRGREDDERERMVRDETNRAVEASKEFRAANDAWERVGSHWECHYHGSGKIMAAIGFALADGMNELIGSGD